MFVTIHTCKYAYSMLSLDQFSALPTSKKLQVIMITLEEFFEVKVFGEMNEKLQQIQQPWDSILITFWSVITEVYKLVIAQWKLLDTQQIVAYQRRIQSIQQQEYAEQEDADLYLLTQLEDG